MRIEGKFGILVKMCGHARAHALSGQGGTSANCRSSKREEAMSFPLRTLCNHATLSSSMAAVPRVSAVIMTLRIEEALSVRAPGTSSATSVEGKSLSGCVRRAALTRKWRCRIRESPG